MYKNCEKWGETSFFRVCTEQINLLLHFDNSKKLYIYIMCIDKNRR